MNKHINENQNLMKTYLLLLLLLLCVGSRAQNDETLFDLEKSFSGKYPALNAIVAQITDAQVLEYGISWRSPLSENVTIDRTYQFLKTGDQLLAFDTYYQMLVSADFQSALSKKFVLKDDKAALLFQDLLSFIDGRVTEGYNFKVGSDWYFIRKVFFDDIEAWKVTVDAKGKVLDIDYSSEMEVSLPDAADGAEWSDLSKYVEETDIPADLHRSMQDYFEEKLTFSQEVEPLAEDQLLPLSDAKIFRVKYAFSETVFEEGYGEYESTSIFEYPVLAAGDQLLFFDAMTELLSSDAFRSTIKDDFCFSDIEKARLFDAVLDELVDYDRRQRRVFQQYNSWFFVRELSFGEPVGFRVEVDEVGKPMAIYYSNDLAVTIPEETFDESTVDWGLAWMDPLETNLTLTEGTTLPFAVAFNEEAASKTGAWLMVAQQGEMKEMYAGTDLYSPYYSEVPGEALTAGHHVIEIYLMRPGNDVSTAYGKISLQIEVLAADK